jgi:hypothetical protein
MYGADGDITIPLDDGSLVIQNAQLTMDNSAAVPGLSFTLRNRTSSPWTKLKLQFEVDARCNGEERHWSRTEETFLGSVKDDAAVRNAPLSEEGKEKAALAVRAYDEVAKVEQERIAAEEKAEQDRIAAEKQAKEDAAAAARQKRRAAERKKKLAEDDARTAKAKAERDARAAEERRQVRAACSAVYQSTADKKIGNLTVREEQQVRACQALASLSRAFRPGEVSARPVARGP